VAAASTVMLLQYLIGNTNLSIMVQHNIRLVQTQDTVRYTVPFDWDYATKHAEDGPRKDGRDIPAEIVAPGQQVPEAMRHAQDPLPRGDVGQDVIH
jgi:hypothetical protein